MNKPSPAPRVMTHAEILLIRNLLRETRNRFRQAGGRGVEDADFLDASQILLSKQRQLRYKLRQNQR